MPPPTLPSGLTDCGSNAVVTPAAEGIMTELKLAASEHAPSKSAQRRHREQAAMFSKSGSNIFDESQLLPLNRAAHPPASLLQKIVARGH